MTESITLLKGDCRDILPTLKPRSIQCVVTSPPYWRLRDYGVEGQIGLELTPEEYVEQLVGVFREIRPPLKDDGTVWLNLGDSYCSSATGSCSNESSWPEGGKKHQAEAWRRPDRKLPTNLKPKDLVGIPWRVAFALQADGWYLRSDIIWHKPNPKPESVKDRTTKAHEYLFLLSKQERYFYDADAIAENYKSTEEHQLAVKWVQGWATEGSHSAIDHAKAKSHRGSKFHTGKTAIHQLEKASKVERRDNPVGRNKHSVWTISTQPYPEAHFATFPEDLVVPCVLAGSRLGDTVLDPFGGSGTVGKVCQGLGRKAVLIELNSEYVEMAEKRTVQAGLPFGETA